jgi:hypothetical protein
VSPEVVLTLLAQLEAALTEWFRHQAPETLKGRLTREEFMVRVSGGGGEGGKGGGQGGALSEERYACMCQVSIEVTLPCFDPFSLFIDRHTGYTFYVCLKLLLLSHLATRQLFLFCCSPRLVCLTLFSLLTYPSVTSCLQSCLELLVSQDSICFFITLLNFMHEEFVRASPSYPHDLEAKVTEGACWDVLGGMYALGCMRLELQSCSGLEEEHIS